MSLAEAGLGLMLGMFALGFVIKMQGQAQEDMRAKNMAESIQSVSQVAAQYLISNRKGIVDAISNGDMAAADEAAAKHCLLGANYETGQGGTVAVNRADGKKTCAHDVAWLKYKRLLPQSFPETNAYNQRWVVIYRQVYGDFDNDPGTPETSNGDMEILVVGATNEGKERQASNSELLLAAELMGGNGGLIPNGDIGGCKYSPTNPSERQACGVGGSWNVNLSDFVD